jgi:hypothetical protein
VAKGSSRHPSFVSLESMKPSSEYPSTLIGQWQPASALRCAAPSPSLARCAAAFADVEVVLLPPGGASP